MKLKKSLVALEPLSHLNLKKPYLKPLYLICQQTFSNQSLFWFLQIKSEEAETTKVGNGKGIKFLISAEMYLYFVVAKINSLHSSLRIYSKWFCAQFHYI